MPSIHRQDDSRVCGATTIVEGQTTVTAGGKLVSVVNDPNSHVEGRFVEPGGRTVSIGFKKVIIVGDVAGPDLLAHPAPPTDAQTGLDTVTIGS